LPGLDGGKVEVEAGSCVLVGVAGSGSHGIILAGFAELAELAELAKTARFA
jgi:hypothetical protein